VGREHSSRSWCHIATGLNVLLAEAENLSTFEVLIISDCEGALDYYDISKKSKLRDTLDVDWMTPYQRILETASKVMMAKVRSTHCQLSGFFDHEAADLISAKLGRQIQQRRIYEWKTAPGLREADLQWLAESEEPRGKAPKPGGSGKRKGVLSERIKQELGLEI
jgi:hypothetical protein